MGNFIRQTTLEQHLEVYLQQLADGYRRTGRCLYIVLL